MSKFKLILLVATLCAALAACSGSKPLPRSVFAAATAPTQAPIATPEHTAASTTAPARSSLLTNTTGKTVFKRITTNKENDISTFIISEAGTVIACDPMQVPADLISDLYTVTHEHHADSAAISMYKNIPHSIRTVESLTVNDVKVQGVAASHTTADVNENDPSIVIYVFDVDDLRIAFFACVGQEKLTGKQIAALGNVDIALITTDTYTGWISVENACGLMKQLAPKMVIPLSHNYTDFGAACESMAKAIGGTVTVADGELDVSKTDLDSASAPQVIKLVKTVLR